VTVVYGEQDTCKLDEGNPMKLDHRVTILVTFVGFALLASLAHARGPDAGGTSAGVCGVLSDATPGLESLCVNYCEVRNCPNSDGRECESLLTNYDRHRRDGDPRMPCLQNCPCFTAQELRDYPVELVECIRDSSADFLFTAVIGESEVDGAASVSNFAIGFYDCVYSDTTVDPPIVRFGGGALDPEDAAVCHAVIEAEIAGRGLICGPL
jgi:hypothetical protein